MIGIKVKARKSTPEVALDSIIFVFLFHAQAIFTTNKGCRDLFVSIFFVLRTGGSVG